MAQHGRDASLLLDILERLVNAGVDGAGPLESSAELAARHRRKRPEPEDAIAALVRAETRKCASVGFLAGLGGFVALPITLPSEIAGAALVEARMVGAIAVLRGWEPHDPKVRMFAQGCLVGQGVADAVKRAGVDLLTDSGSAAGRRLLTRTAARLGAKTLPALPARAVPLVGGVVGGATDAAICRSIALLALRELPTKPGPPRPAWDVDGTPIALPPASD